jgi:hypothetical protein
MSLGLLLALALSAQTDAAAPAPTPPAAAPAPATTQVATKRDAATGDPNRRVCRAQAATGSRLGSAKICKTAREWDEQRIAAKAELERHQRNDGSNNF